MATSIPNTAEARVTEFVRKANDEYARLGQIVSKGLDARDAGKPYNDEAVTIAIAQMSILSETLALVTGTDHIIQGVRLDRQAQARRDEVFPYTTFLGPQNPIWPEKR